MAKNWWWLTLAGLALAGCSSGAAAAVGSGSRFDPTTTSPTSAPAAAPATTAVPATTTTTAPVRKVVEFVTPSGLTHLRVTYPGVVSDADRPVLDAYVQFLRMVDLIGDTRDPADPLVESTSTAGVKDKVIDTASRLQRTGEVFRGTSDHWISIYETYPDKIKILDCLTDNIGEYRADGQVVGFGPTGKQYVAAAFLVEAGGFWKVRSYIPHEDQSCSN